MQNFIERIKRHAEHIEKNGQLCTTEETTKQALILPLLDILGFSPFDPSRVKAEHGAGFPGAKAAERVDYALFCNSVPVMFIEAKAWAEKLTNHAPQLSRYFNSTPEVAVAAITNGREWRFFTDLNNKNVMDTEPFLTVDFAALDESQISRLYRFRHDEFQPDALRSLAEESIYLNDFTEIISNSLRDPDTEFVRYVADRAKVQRQFTAKFLESIVPIVRQAVGRAVSNMVVTGLSAQPKVESEPNEIAPKDDPYAAQIDPENPRIVTTYAERRLFEVTRLILGDVEEIESKDTESYFSVLYQGKVSRWVIRYWADKKAPYIKVSVPLDEARKREIDRAGLKIGAGDTILLPNPDDLMRVTGIVFDALAYVKDDNNFKHKSRESAPPDVS
jgi:hypothetical protein